MKNPFRSRIARIHAHLKALNEPACLVLSSAPEMIRTRDQFYSYRQDSDFFYLTGSLDSDLTIVISSEKKDPILLAPPQDKTRALWDGPSGNFKAISNAINANLVVTSNPHKEIREFVKGTALLFHQNRPGTASTRIAQELQSLPSFQRGNNPIRYAHVDAILEEMRLYKEPFEVDRIRDASAVTIQAIIGTLPTIIPGSKELAVARTLEYFFGMMDAVPGFGTIAASGKSAATLHYRGSKRTLRKGELLLLDCGAEYNMYNSDISRVFPIGGIFSQDQLKLYNIVLEAQLAAINKIKHGVLIKNVYDAAARVLTEGLVDLKVLRGKVTTLIAKKAYLPYFPHGIGHSLGIDVHDVGKLRGNNSITLKEGMVFTVEPGLYFSKAIGRVPPCGVRIEDDVLVTKKGCTILTGDMPKFAEDIQAFMD